LVDEALLEDEFSFDDFAAAAPTFPWFAAEFPPGCLLVPLPPGNAAWSVF